MSSFKTALQEQLHIPYPVYTYPTIYTAFGYGKIIVIVCFFIIWVLVVKYIFLSSILFFGLVGCTSITTMSSEQFNQLSTTQLPFSGNWSGQVGEASAVLHLNRQGHGKLCIDNSKEVMSYRVKLVNDVLYSDQGLKFNVKSINASQANLHMRMLGLGVTFELNKDDPLNNVTSNCKTFINS